jgi:hypothetical protein
VRISRAGLVRTGRIALTASALALTTSGLTLLGSATASATVLQDKDCTSAVHGVIGDTVSIEGSLLRDLVKRGASEAGSLAVSEWAASDIEKAGVLEVGTVPDAQSGKVTGDAIATVATEKLRDMGSWGLGLDREKTLDSIHNKISGSCGFTVFASNYSAPSSARPPAGDGNGSDTGDSRDTAAPPVATAPGSTPPSPLGGTGDTKAAPRDYGNIPAAQAPAAGIALPPELRYAPSAAVPGQAPGVGVLGADQAPQAQPEVRNAGNADPLAADSNPPGNVQLPMLLAVVALAAVTAGLVRSWVLHRAS